MAKNIVMESVQTLRMESVHLREQINLKDLPLEVSSRTKTEATVPLSPAGYAFIFSFGCVVFFNVPRVRQEELLRQLGPLPEETSTDDFRIAYQPDAADKVLFDRAILRELSEPRLRLVARTLAQSTALETIERMVETLVERSAHMTDTMRVGGKVPGRERDLVRFIGTALGARRSVLSSLAVLDAPDVTWDDSVLDRMFTELRTNFEIDTRVAILEKKIELVVDGCEILADLMKSRREHFLEWVVIILIALELVVPLLMYGKP